MPKQARLSRIKSLQCYTIDEAAEITGVSPRTVRNWAKNGLQLMDHARPVLIRGDDLRTYLKAQRETRKVKTGLDQFYCCRCGQARKAAADYVECVIIGKRATLSGFCATCETVVSKPIAEARISEFARILDLTITRPEATL